MSGCTKSSVSTNSEVVPAKQVEQIKEKTPVNDVLTLPISEYGERLRYKVFGEYIQDRFKGYHIGDDIEYEEENKEVPVSAIAKGTIAYIGRVDGYGGLIVIKHRINAKTIHALYGHLDLSSSTLKENDTVVKGQFLANLGNNKSVETDGERKHLHFALYEGDEVRFGGYESSAEKIASWINPYDFFRANGVAINKQSRTFKSNSDLGGDLFALQFTIPKEWEVEYIPSIKALNLFTLAGTGAARDRSQILIRYFDANDFLTLSTVTIHDTKDVKIGTKDYMARRYDIEKKTSVGDFADQPFWRNKRHIVTDFRGQEGFTRYYVVAAKPELDVEIYESVLASMTINK